MNAITGHTHSAIRALITVAIAALLGLTLAGCGSNDANKTGKLNVTVNAEGYNADTSTPVEIAVYKDDVKGLLEDEDETNDPEALTTFTGDANEQFEIAEAADKGTYTVVVKATPVLEDGTLFSIPEIQVVEVGSDDAAATFDLEPIDLATASAEEVAEVTEQASEAAANSGNDSKAAAASAGVAAAATKAEKSGNASAASTAKQQAAKPSSSSKPSASQGGSTSGSSSASKPAQTQPSAPAHEHNWVAQTTQKKVIDSPAHTIWTCSCGMEFSSGSALSAHQESKGPGTGHGRSSNRVVKEKSHMETIITGYKCSSCGATK